MSEDEEESKKFRGKGIFFSAMRRSEEKTVEPAAPVRVLNLLRLALVHSSDPFTGVRCLISRDILAGVTFDLERPHVISE